MDSIFVTGAAGFIGSNLVDRLLGQGLRVTGYDNFSTGQRRNLEAALENPRFTMLEGDLLNPATLTRAMAGADTVFHLAANADIRFGLDAPDRDLQQNTIATFNVLEAMRANGVRDIAFSSTGSVYGEAKVVPTPEDAPFPIQTSLYAASKLAGEGMIAAYAEGYGMQARIFRFVSLLGPRYSHGHVFDFTRALLLDRDHLTVLGDGRQRKSYLHVDDCIDAMLLAMAKANGKVKVFNLGHDDSVVIDQSAAWICEALDVRPAIVHTGGERGWVGDNPLIHLDNARIKALGWAPKHSIEASVKATVAWLLDNRWILEARS